MSKRTHDDKKKADDDAPLFKVPNKEMILTRGKSTQLRRQLRSKDGSPKKSTAQTQPQKVTRPAPKAVTKSPPAKPSLQAEKPQKPVKKVVLKPPQRLRKIESTKLETRRVVNKRKTTQPQKTVDLDSMLKSRKSPSPNRFQKSKPTPRVSDSQCTDRPPNVGKPRRSLKQRCLGAQRGKDVSLAELIRLQERTEELTDEDLLEIAECPSPVWWEDPPHEGYKEDPIFVGSSTTSSGKKREVTPAENVNSTSCTVEHQPTLNIQRIPDSNCDQGFIKKRSALENVLSGIITKVGKSSDKLSTQTCTTSKPKAEEFVSEMASSRKQNVHMNSIINNGIPELEKSHHFIKDADLVAVGVGKMAGKKLLNLAASSAENSIEMMNKMHAHIPNIRNVTADCMRTITKNKQLEVKKVYSGTDSAELIPSKTNRRLDIFIDLSEEAETEGNCSDAGQVVATREAAPVNAQCANLLPESDSKLSKEEDEVLKDLENFLIPIARPMDSSECIVIDEDEEKVDSENNESFLDVRESVETQPVSDSQISDIAVDLGNGKPISSTPSGVSSLPQVCGKQDSINLSQIKSVPFLASNQIKCKVRRTLKRSCESDSKIQFKRIKTHNNSDNTSIQYIRRVSSEDDKGIDFKTLPFKVLHAVKRIRDGDLENQPNKIKTHCHSENQIQDIKRVRSENDKEIEPISLSDHEKNSDTISDKNIKFLHEDRLLKEIDKKQETSAESAFTDDSIGKKDKTGISVNSKIQQAYRELVSNLAKKRFDLIDNIQRNNNAINMNESQIQTNNENSKPEIVTLNSSTDTIIDSDEEKLDENSSEKTAAKQFFNGSNIVTDTPVTYEVVTTDTNLMESLNEEYLDLDENNHENETIHTVEVKTDYEQVAESEGENSEYEQINKIEMTKEMIADIIGVQESKVPDVETTDKLVQQSVNSKSEPSKQNIVIAQSGNVKYCFSCSSIYDTDECCYCQRINCLNRKTRKVFACRQCEYWSLKRGNTIAHVVTHTNDKPFSCDQCKLSFKTKATLKIHLLEYCKVSNRKTKESSSKLDHSYNLQYSNSQEKILADDNEIIVVLAES